MTDQSQWKATLREDSDGNTIVRFSLERDRGHIQMAAPAGDLDPGDLDGAMADQIRRRAKSCIISWRDDAGLTRTVEARVVGGMVLVSNRDGAVLALSDERIHGEIGDQGPEWLISHVRSLV